MKRSPIVLSATVAGLAATLAFNPHKPATATATQSASTTSASTPSQSASASGTTTSGSSGSPGASSSSSTSSAPKSATSDAIDTQYGPIQLKVTVANGKIKSIEALEAPSNDPKSQSINAYAVPQLTQSALSRQDGTVDAVSGATFTSHGYASALQSALDKAGFQA